MVILLECGFIKLYRSLLNWEWYDDINTKTLFLHLLLTVNYEDKKWHGMEINRGSRITSLAKLAEETKLSVKSVRTALKHLNDTGEVASQGHAQNTVISIVNYNLYQQEGKPKANQGQAEGKQTANEGQLCKKEEESNKAKKEKESTYAHFGEFQNVLLTPEEHGKLQERFGNNETANAVEELSAYCKSHGRKYQDYYATLLNWIKSNEKKNQQQQSLAQSRQAIPQYIRTKDTL